MSILVRALVIALSLNFYATSSYSKEVCAIVHPKLDSELRRVSFLYMFNKETAESLLKFFLNNPENFGSFIHCIDVQRKKTALI